MGFLNVHSQTLLAESKLLKWGPKNQSFFISYPGGSVP